MIAVVGVILIAHVLVSMSASAPSPTCFVDGDCFDFTTFILTDSSVTTNASAMWADACANFSGFQIYPGLCDDANSSISSLIANSSQTWIPNLFASMYRFELMAITIYPQGPFMGPRGAKLRQWAGLNVTLDFKSALMLSASGFNRISQLRAQLLPPYEQGRDIVFRGFAAMAPPGSVLSSCNLSTGPFTFPPSFQYTPWDFVSTTMSLQLDLGWATFSLLAIKLQVSRFASPLAEDLEVDLMPGSRLQLLECSSYFDSATNQTLPLIFAAETTFGAVNEKIVLGELKSEIGRQQSACYPALCNFDASKQNPHCVPPPRREPIDFWDPLSGDLYVVNSTCQSQ